MDAPDIHHQCPIVLIVLNRLPVYHFPLEPRCCCKSTLELFNANGLANGIFKFDTIGETFSEARSVLAV